MQVLVDAILQLEDHAVFRESIEQHEQQQELGEQQDQQQKQPQHPQPVHYSARLLHNMQPAVAQDILSWGVDEWHTCFTTTASEISIMLHVLARDVGRPALHQPTGPAATGMEHLGHQRIVQVRQQCGRAACSLSCSHHYSCPCHPALSHYILNVLLSCNGWLRLMSRRITLRAASCAGYIFSQAASSHSAASTAPARYVVIIASHSCIRPTTASPVVTPAGGRQACCRRSRGLHLR